MRQKAAAYKMYGDAAMTALVLEALPKVKLNLVSALISYSGYCDFNSPESNENKA